MTGIVLNVANRTRGSVHGSLPALASLVTDWSEAAGTMKLRPSGPGKRPRGSFPDCQHHGGPRARLDGMPNTCELHAGTVNVDEPKVLTGSGQNRHAVGCSLDAWECTDYRDRRCNAGAKPSVVPSSKHGKPATPPRPLGAGAAARRAVGVSGRGCWRKQTPSCNGADRRCNITPPRKRADFQRVVRYEKAGRTFAGENRK